MGIDVLSLVYRLASNPDTSADALNLLHELQVHQVELDLLEQEIEAEHSVLADELGRYKTAHECARIALTIVVLGGVPSIPGFRSRRKPRGVDEPLAAAELERYRSERSRARARRRVIAVLLLDRDLNVRRFTGRAPKIISLRESAIGRPMSELTTSLQYLELHDDVLETLRTLRLSERQMRPNGYSRIPG